MDIHYIYTHIHLFVSSIICIYHLIVPNNLKDVHDLIQAAILVLDIVVDILLDFDNILEDYNSYLVEDNNLLEVDNLVVEHMLADFVDIVLEGVGKEVGDKVVGYFVEDMVEEVDTEVGIDHFPNSIFHMHRNHIFRNGN